MQKAPIYSINYLMKEKNGQMFIYSNKKLHCIHTICVPRAAIDQIAKNKISKR